MTDGQPGRNRALEARGASAVLHKLLDEAELTDALGRVARGAPVGAGEPAATDGERPLSGRELSILALVATGQTNAEIGSSLFLATKTVERQVSTIVQKLGARNRAHAAAIAVARDLIEPP
jgi:two-component system response regulator DesR